MKKNYSKRSSYAYKKMYWLATIFILAFSYSPLKAQTITFNYTGNSETYIIPAGVTEISIEANGGQGGDGFGGTGGLGATMIGEFSVAPGDQLEIVVGNAGQTFGNSGGGGAGTGVFINGTLAILAGGGGGGANNESGKPGLITLNGGDSSGAGGTNGSGGQKGYISGDCGWAAGGAGYLSDGYGGNSDWDGGILPGVLSQNGAGLSWSNGGDGGSNGGCNFSYPNEGAWGLSGGGAGSYGGAGGGAVRRCCLR